MLHNTIDSIERRVQSASTIGDDSRQELLRLLTTLRKEVADLSRTRSEHAESIAGFTEASTREAIREEKDEDLLKLSLQGLSTSVRDFETTHPRLVEIVNSICHMLSNIGI